MATDKHLGKLIGNTGNPTALSLALRLLPAQRIVFLRCFDLLDDTGHFRSQRVAARCGILIRLVVFLRLVKLARLLVKDRNVPQRV